MIGHDLRHPYLIELWTRLRKVKREVLIEPDYRKDTLKDFCTVKVVLFVYVCGTILVLIIVYIKDLIKILLDVKYYIPKG